MSSAKNKLLTNVRSRILDTRFIDFGDRITDPQIAILLGELQIAQLELEMQNDELIIASELLETERAKFAGFFDLAPIGYFIVDPLGRITEANNMGAHLLAVSREKLMYQRLQDFIEVNEFGKFLNFWHQMLFKNLKQSVDIKLLRTDGKLIFTKMEGIAVKNSFTNQLYYHITLSDITESKLAQLQLKETADRLELALVASGTGIWSLDVESALLSLDKFSLSLLEYEKHRFDGNLKSFVDNIHPEDRQNVWDKLNKDLEKLNGIDLEFKYILKNGKTKYLKLRGKISTALSGKKFIGVISDITEAKEIQINQQELEREKNKLIIETTFKAQETERYRFSSILHDSICQLLYGIRLNLQHIEEKNPSNKAYEAIEELLALAIKETRELSYELTPSVLRDFGFNESMRDMANRLSSNHFKIYTNVKPTADSLETDILLSMFRIIQELINNIIKHANASRADVLVCTEGGIITIKVKDNGTGIRGNMDDIMAKGSGLRSIKNRISLLNGTLDFYVKKGTQVTVRFKI